MRVPRTRRWAWVWLVVLLAWAAAMRAGWHVPPSVGVPGEGPAGVHLVERVVDGDTLIVAPRQRVRLQGIDAPELRRDYLPDEPWSVEATEFAREFVRNAGGRLRLERDGEASDQYGRWLRFAWHGERLLNVELVHAGLARARLGYAYSQAKKDLLHRAEGEARRAGRGIWSGPATR